MPLLAALAASAALWVPSPGPPWLPDAPATSQSQAPAAPQSRPQATAPSSGKAALAATIGEVRCPRREVPVVVQNATDKPHYYELQENGSRVRVERVPANDGSTGSP